MSDDSSATPAGDLNPEERQSALFGQLVLQQTNLALVLLGKVPNPQTGEATRDLESARLLIDQLEMLEAKTKGNLTREETHLLQQSLMTLRLVFVEEVESAEPATAKGSPRSSSTSPAADAKGPPRDAPGEPAEEESRKRFTKKYSG
jgi:hypothetical protein